MKVVASITARLLLGSKRAAAVAIVLLIPVAIAIVFRFSDEYHRTNRGDFAIDLTSTLILALLLPLVALVLGTTAIGTEIEDGTVVFLLSKPVSRPALLATKAFVAALATVILAVPTTVATAWIITGSAGDGGIVAGLGLAALVASVVYTVLFAALSTVTGRALIAGLIYVFVWEGVLANLFSGLAWLSVRQYALGVADAAISLTWFSADLSTTSAVVMALIAVAGALWIGGRKLAAFEIGERA
ncbi:MAG TPA: ABC transporter permease subunit [Ilumatobacter sp.]|nr:ABC transporter permease subunit [Ilumatobacter sp.]